MSFNELAVKIKNRHSGGFICGLFKEVLYCLCSQTCTDTACADILSYNPVVFNNAYFLNIGSPDFISPFIRMAYAFSKLNRFSADFTLCHGLILEFVISRQLKNIWT